MQLDNCSQIFTLGPEGTFSDEAAQIIRGDGVIVTYTGTFAEALFRVTEDQDSVAVVPIENSVAGTVAQVQDSMVSNKFLSKNLTEPQNQLTRSNVDSGIQFLQAIKSDNGALAAIVPASFADSYPEWKVANGIQDYHNNTTRFLVVRPRQENEEHDFSRKKTSLYVEFQEDRSGLLYELLSVFNLFQINLCRLESRPAKDTPWAYVFYVDFYNTEHTEACLDVMRVTKFNYKVLGSYDLIDRLA